VPFSEDYVFHYGENRHLSSVDLETGQ